MGSSYASKDYCLICVVKLHYSVNELNDVKYSCFNLEGFYHDIFTDLNEILKIDPTAKFWYEGFMYSFNVGEVQGSCELYDVIDNLYDYGLSLGF